MHQVWWAVSVGRSGLLDCGSFHRVFKQSAVDAMELKSNTSATYRLQSQSSISEISTVRVLVRSVYVSMYIIPIVQGPWSQAVGFTD